MTDYVCTENQEHIDVYMEMLWNAMQIEDPKLKSLVLKRIKSINQSAKSDAKIISLPYPACKKEISFWNRQEFWSTLISFLALLGTCLAFVFSSFIAMTVWLT